MRLFRKSPDLRRAQLRPLTGADLAAASRLLHESSRRYYALSISELPALLEAGHGVALEIDTGLYGIALAGRPTQGACWLRLLAVADGLAVAPALTMLLEALHRSVAVYGATTIFYAGDDGADAWMIPVLKPLGYQVETEVIVYEKRYLNSPAVGNLAVVIRPAQAADLDAVVRLDRRCFSPEWTKDDLILSSAIAQGPYFKLAESDGLIVGYAYASSHSGGYLLHLVRIAVDPERHGSGIGVRLLDDLVNFAVDQSAQLITLNTQAYNSRAQRLYHWFGFSPTGERQPILCHRLPS
jgi:ribosomal protein S18 acetylase RimI-like enzyme